MRIWWRHRTDVKNSTTDTIALCRGCSASKLSFVCSILLRNCRRSRDSETILSPDESSTGTTLGFRVADSRKFRLTFATREDSEALRNRSELAKLRRSRSRQEFVVLFSAHSFNNVIWGRIWKRTRLILRRIIEQTSETR